MSMKPKNQFWEGSRRIGRWREGLGGWFAQNSLFPEVLIEFGIQIVVNDLSADQASFAKVHIHVGISHVAFIHQFGDPSWKIKWHQATHISNSQNVAFGDYARPAGGSHTSLAPNPSASVASAASAVSTLTPCILLSSILRSLLGRALEVKFYGLEG